MKKSSQREGTVLPAAQSVKAEIQTVASDTRIARLQARKDLVLAELFTDYSRVGEDWLKMKMEEFEEVVRDLATLKARRNAQPVVKPFTVTLDEHASRLVRSIMLDDANLSPADVVNGCVYFHTDDDHTDSPECFEAARAARLEREEVG